MSLGLYHLLTPYFLAGFTFPDEVDAYLSTLGVADLTAIHDDAATAYTGILTWGDAPKRQKSPAGGGFAWEDITVRFRLVVPRDGANFINTAVHALPAQQLADLLDRFFPIDQTGLTFTEYPGVRFRLELLLDELHFELSEDAWKPGKLDADHRVVRDPSITGPVRIVLPKVALSYEQTDDFQSPPTLRLLSWGSGGFEAPSTLRAGELGRMEPPIAAHTSGRLGFGFGEVVIDGDPDNTPPEILKFFGTGESFTGIYVQSARLYWADEGKDFAINCALNDLLISFAGQVSFDTSVDFIGPESTLSAALRLVDQGKDVLVSPGSKQQQSTVVSGGKVRASTAATGGIEVTGGVPPLSVSLKAGTTELYDSATGQVSLAALTPGEHTLALRVHDSATEQQSYDEDIALTLLPAPATTATPTGLPADRPAQPGDLPAITTANPVSDDGHAITHAGTVSGTRERFRVTGVGTPEVSVGGTTVSVDNGFFEVDVPENTNALALTASWPAITAQPAEFRLHFTKGWPRLQDSPVIYGQYVLDTVADSLYESNGGTAALHDWLTRLASGGSVPDVSVDGHASFEFDTQAESDQALSQRRVDVAVAAVGIFGNVTHQQAHGHTEAANAHRVNQAVDRVAVFTVTTSQPATTASLSVSRGQRPAQGTPVERKPTPPPAPVPNKPPGVFRRIGIRVKVIRNEPVLVELTGQLDFETGLEASLRNPAGATPLPPGGSLELTQQPAAVADPNSNPKDGVVDFRLTVVHDSATHSWTETLAIGAHPDDVDGLLQLTNPHSGPLTPANRLKDMLGSVLILAPIIGTAAGAADPKSAGSYAVLGGVIVGAAALGAAGFIQTEKITLYGGELRLRQYIPPNDPAVFTDAGVVFDYAVEFAVKVSELDINTTKPLKVRYRALGFNLNFPNGQYQPIFDTSKGYELDLSDPGLFKLPSPIDNVLKIFGARIAKVNPLTVEFDLGLKVDLGVVKVDRFKVKIPVDPPGVPTILPSGISLNIAKVLVGSGFVNIVEPPAAPPGKEQPGFGGIEGAFDVTLVPIKLRIAASFGIRPITSDDGLRKATAVFLGLIIDLPSPILLGNSGVAIYGFSGLFAMHYKRLEPTDDPTDAVSPALMWLKNAGGEPAKLFNNGEQLWGPEFDRWSFGIGIMLGTSEGGFLVNLRGMFVLELPGPRILVFVKIVIVAVLQDLKPATDLTIGILGVIDLDFARMSFTVGVIVDLEIKEIVAVVIPVEIYTKLDDFTQWHLYIGTFSAPASAMIFNIVRGFGYVMISGPNIDNWPGYDKLRTLPGIAMAAGVGASIVFGDEGLGLFLKVCARADVAISFSPRLFLIGLAQLDGELRLFVVSVGAHGRLEVEAPDPNTHLHGEICGHVDLFFFKVEGCVTVDIGQTPPPPPPPALVRNVWLQSHAPVITAGQGGDRPIDASLGDAVAPGETAPVVPIDAVPVIQFQTAPTVGALTTFTAPIGTAPGTRPGGWVSIGGSRRVTYALTALRLTGGPLPGPGVPPAAWRPDPTVDPMSGRTNIDLALLSNVPMMGARALERSADLTGIVEATWGGVCTPVAPPVAVLWTFCRQPLGPSGHGWTLTGHAWPDPPDTSRDTPVDVTLRVDEPEPEAANRVLDGILGHTSAGRIDPARVIGPNSPPPVDPPTPGPQECADIGKEIKDGDPNPAQVKLFRVTVFDAKGVPFPRLRFSGVGATRGLDVGWHTELALTATAAEVTVTLVTFAQPATVAAFDAAGALVDQQVMSGAQRVLEAIVLSGKDIVRVVVDAPQDETVMLRVCVRAEARRAAWAVAAAPDLACMRALQLPEQRVPGGRGDVALTPELARAAQNRSDDRWVDLRTGPLMFARLHLAVAKTLYDKDMVVVEQLDHSGAVLRGDPLSALHPLSTLPGTWTDPTGPWRSEVDSVIALLADPDIAKLVRVVVSFEPLPDTVRLRIRARGKQKTPVHPAVVLAVAEVLTGSEQDRAGTEEVVRTGKVDTLAGYLGGTSQVPLLTPGRDYTLEIDYVPTTEDSDPKGNVTRTAYPVQTERFSFTTDSEPPKRLDAYVLATSPRHEERFVFADETLEIVFNDLQVVQLYAAYGKQLRAVLRPADGTAVPAHQVSSLDEVPARYTSPLMDTLDAMAKAGKLPCVGPYHVEGHGKFTFPEPLRPSMAYTLDIETVPAPNLVPGKPIVPLFRRQFTTGRFISVAALVDEVKANPVRHTVISGPITGLPGPAAADVAIEQALSAAGLPVPGAPAAGGRTVLWRPVGSGHHVPHAVLIDASEPLWRLRDVPKQEPVDGSTDPSFQRIVPGEEPSLELRGTAPVTRFVRSPSGTRTLAFLDDAVWPAAGATVVIDAVRPASTLYGTAGQLVNISTLRLGGGAPWEDDNA